MQQQASFKPAGGSNEEQSLPGSTIPVRAGVYQSASSPDQTDVSPTGSSDSQTHTARPQRRYTMGETITQLEPMHLTDGPSSVLYRLWCELDTDRDGHLHKDEFSAIVSRLGVKWDVEKVWMSMVKESDMGEVEHVRKARKALGHHITFSGFVSVYNRLMGQARRATRLDVKTTFEKLQYLPEGLHKEGILKLSQRCKAMLYLLPPVFNIDEDWALMQKLSDDDDEQETIVFLVFERWWKYRMGLMESDTPVIPEFFQYKLEELATAERKFTDLSPLNTSLKGRIRHYNGQGSNDSNSHWRGTRPPRELWKILKGRLSVLVSMSRDWGSVSDFYGSVDSQFGTAPLAWNVRDPESGFSTAWDLMQVMFLGFVSYTVPYRAGFGVEIEMFSMAWVWDTIVDLYFIIDLVLNFFTAFDDGNGVREARHKMIAHNYVRGWFIVDAVSCIPVQYIMLLLKNEEGGGNFKIIKTLRLLRLSKMLRLARIKRILAKYENLEFVQQYSGMIGLMFIIAFAGHLLACFWYMIGLSPGVDRQGNQVPGWVLLEYCPKCADPTDGGYEPCDSPAFQTSEEDCPIMCDWVPADRATGAECVRSSGCVAGCELDPTVSMGTRYITSIYYVFNALDGNGRTDGERAFAVFGYIVMVIIDGAVAGVLSSVLISMGGTDRIVNEKLAAAKFWMQEHRISKTQQVKALNYFRHVYRSHVMYQEAEILNTMPPSMRLEFSTHLYATHLAQVPLFRGLGNSVIHALCRVVEPMLAVKGQLVFAEGSVGKEMYILISGELEITCNGARLGFLSDGAFFGETPLLDKSAEAEKRRRTVIAMTDCKLCFITRDALGKMLPDYPELALKIKRCARCDKRHTVNKKGKKFKMALQEAGSNPLSAMLSPHQHTRMQRSSSEFSTPGAFAQPSNQKLSPMPLLLPTLSSGPTSTTPAAQQTEGLSGLSQRIDDLQKIILRMDARSEQTATSVKAILQHLKM